MYLFRFVLFCLVFCFSCITYDNPDYVLEPGVEIRLHGYKGASEKEFQDSVNDVVNKFSAKFPDVNVKDLFQSRVYVVFDPGLGKCSDYNAMCPTTLVGWTNGLTVSVYYSVIGIDGKYGTDEKASLNQLAFEHELAHVLLMRSKKVPVAEQDAFIGVNFGF